MFGTGAVFVTLGVSLHRLSRQPDMACLR